MTISGIDISHYQGSPNFAAIRAAGVGLVFIKATQGTGYVDPQFAADRAGARAAGLQTGLYHFASATDPVAEANFFCNAVGSLNPGELVALDWETQTADPVAWSLSFLRQVEARLGVKPLIYLNQSTVNGFNWDAVVANNNGLWLAKYDYNAGSIIAVPHWAFVAIKQYSDKGTVSGVAGGVDLDTFEGDAAALARYGYQGAAPAPAPAPKPAPAPSFDVRNWRADAGATGQIFVDLQNWANHNFPAYSHIAPTAPVYGPATIAFLKEFAHRSGIASADGRNIGPQIAQSLFNAGFRG